MRQILQSLSSGATELAHVPVPVPSPRSLLVEARASVVSAGTERMLVDFGRSNLLAKARQQPDKVRQVLDKVRTDGLMPTLEAVRSKMEAPIPLGYCHAGVVREVGPQARGFQVGDRVVSNGPHAEYVRVPWTLAARIPEGVPFESAAFTPLAAIGLHGLRLAAPTLGETVVVYGLGLIGLLTVQLARAAGCRVIGIDRDGPRLQLAQQFGAEPVDAGARDPAGAVHELTAGIGADAVLLTLAADSDEPAHLAAAMSRQRGRIVLVGVTGLGLRRDDFYRKELSFQVSCSYGPGRYDPAYEEAGNDYPIGHVRWTEARNFVAVLQLMASGQVDPRPLVTHRFDFARAPEAYGVVTSPDPSLGIVLEYPEREAPPGPAERVVTLRDATVAGRAVVGCIGAGNFASRMLVPALARAGASLHTIVSPGSTSATIVARSAGFAHAASDVDAVLANPAIDTVMVATRHDSHAQFALAALRAGKHVFVEKPLALTQGDLNELEQAAVASGRVLTVGFNRRFAPLTQRAERDLRGRSGPLAVLITVNAGAVPGDHWTKDPESGGGRIVGEGVHFIDLARYFVGHAIEAIDVNSAAARGAGRLEDTSSLNLAFADGSIAAITYLANGHRAFPKERIELFWEGRTLQIDNFRRLHGWGVASSGRWIRERQDKGHGALVASFLSAVRGEGPPPIPLEELFEVSRWAIRAGELARGLGGA